MCMSRSSCDRLHLLGVESSTSSTVRILCDTDDDDDDDDDDGMIQKWEE